jgi:hypothetical protein
MVPSLSLKYTFALSVKYLLIHFFSKTRVASSTYIIVPSLDKYFLLQYMGKSLPGHLLSYPFGPSTKMISNGASSNNFSGIFYEILIKIAKKYRLKIKQLTNIFNKTL